MTVVAFQVILVSNAICSAIMLWLLLRETDQDYQIFILFIWARCIDWVFLSGTLWLTFRFLFSLKRVSIQMSDKYNTIDDTLKALKRHNIF